MGGRPPSNNARVPDLGHVSRGGGPTPSANRDRDGGRETRQGTRAGPPSQSCRLPTCTVPTVLPKIGSGVQPDERNGPAPFFIPHCGAKNGKRVRHHPVAWGWHTPVWIALANHHVRIWITNQIREELHVRMHMVTNTNSIYSETKKILNSK
jgi:hypothetical protein